LYINNNYANICAIKSGDFMEDINIICNDNNSSEFLNYQYFLKEDFKKIRNILESYNESENKKLLVAYINNLISSLEKCILVNYNNTLQFKLTDKYAIFSYYDYNENFERLFNIPTVVILKRNIKEIYFITELYSEDLSSICYSFIQFKLDNNNVLFNEFDLPNYSHEMFDNAFNNPDDHIYLIKYLMNKKNR